MCRGGYRRGAGRKAAWRHGETKTIRVPIALREQLLEVARQLDRGEYISESSYSELTALLSQWQAKCDAEPADSVEWQKVRQLLNEIAAVLSPRIEEWNEALEHSEEFYSGYGKYRGRRFGQFGRGRDSVGFCEDVGLEH
ncbi:MAG: hypothetical protein QNJ70_13600 [Xenococcaceae cyanobacterium MO_207.B15]|nr:hypothetical protein [Xenococcaceae cyanobacterium MO_207.B15]